jgi:hypothetical protein
MKSFKEFKAINEMMMASGGAIRGAGHVSGSPDGNSTEYADNNMFDFYTLDDLVLRRIKDHVSLHNSSLKGKKRLKTSVRYVEEQTKTKRKYLGKLRGKTATGQKAHVIDTDPSIEIRGKHSHA